MRHNEDPPRTLSYATILGMQSDSAARNRWRALPVSVLIFAAAIIAARASLGPFHLGPVPVNSPMNIEGFFALAFLGFVLLREPGALPHPARINDWACAAGLLLIVTAAFGRSLWFPLLSDDYILVTQARHGAISLLKPFIEPGGDGSYRPIGYALLMFTGKWAQTEAFRWHLVSLGFHAVNSLLVYAATRYAFKRADLAVLAAAIFAVHGTRPEAVTWAAGRWDLLAAFFVLLGLLAFLNYYETGSAVSCIVSSGLVVIAIMCKESAFAFPALALAFITTGKKVSRRVITTVVAPLLMLVYRLVLFQGPGGYIDPQTGSAQILSIRFLPSLKAMFPRFWSVLLFPINWSQEPEFYLVAGLILMLGCGIVLCIAAGFETRIRGLVLIACTMASALPAVHLLGIGSDLLGSRIMYLPVIVFGLLLSVAITSLRHTQLRRVISICVVMFYAATLLHNLSVWDRVSKLADQTCISAARRLDGAGSAAIVGLPVAIDGVSFFANGLPECVALHSSNPPGRWTVTHLPGPVADHPGTAVLVWDGETQSLR